MMIRDRININILQAVIRDALSIDEVNIIQHFQRSLGITMAVMIELKVVTIIGLISILLFQYIFKVL